MLWFRNLQIYRLADDHALTAEAINAALSKRPFTPCGSMDTESYGWIAPARHEPEALALARQNAVLVALKIETKILPAAAIKDELDKRVEQIETELQRKVGRKEQKELKDRIIDELLPRALSRTGVQRALIDLENNLVIVDAASGSKAEFLLSSLREALGSLPTRLIETETSPTAAMTLWLSEGTPDDFDLGQAATLKYPGEEGSTAKLDKQAMDCEEVRQHLAASKIVTRLALSHKDRLSFTLTGELGIKSLAMLDVLKDEVKDLDAATQDALFESQFALLIGELREFIPAVIEALGGEKLHA